jgi:hypothetical protein
LVHQATFFLGDFTISKPRIRGGLKRNLVKIRKEGISKFEIHCIIILDSDKAAVVERRDQKMGRVFVAVVRGLRFLYLDGWITESRRQ